jgi:predicted phage-related endonuclease
MVGKVTPYDIMTGSNLPAMFGLNIFKSANEVLQEAIDYVNGNTPQGINPNEAMNWGNTLEPVIAQQATVRLGLGNPKTTHNMGVFHKDWPLAVSLDATVMGDGREQYTDIDKGIIVMNDDKPIKLDGEGCLEIKVTGSEAEYEPAPYRGVYQLQAQMACTNSSWGAICVLYRGTIMRLFIYKPESDMLERIKEIAEDFARRIEKYKRNQEIEWYDITSPREAAAIYNEVYDKTVELPQIENDVRALFETNQDIRQLHDYKSVLESKIMAQMKEAKYAKAGKCLVEWGSRSYKPQPAKEIPAKEGYTIRNKTLKVKEI